MTLCYLVFLEAYKTLEEIQKPAEMIVIIARFMCGMSLHLFLASELSNALKKMKYACNHHWKFVDYKVAFLAGLLQTITIMTVELVNLLLILMETSIVEIVMNHMAIVVIS